MRSTRQWPRSATRPDGWEWRFTCEDGQLGHRRQPGARRSDGRQPQAGPAGRGGRRGERSPTRRRSSGGGIGQEGPGRAGPRCPRRCAVGRSPHIGRLIEDNAEALARLVTAEIGKPYAEALGEVREIVDTCDFFLGEGRRLYGQTVPSEMPDKQLFTFRRPVGAVAVITAGNFPVAVPSWYIVPALLAGNTIVWKPAEYSRGRARLPSTSCSSAAAGCPTGSSTSCTPTGRRPSPGCSKSLGGRAHRQGRLHRVIGGRPRRSAR